MDPDCPVCDGFGTLTLGEAALHHYHPRVVGEAITLTLEAHARQADAGQTLSDDRLSAVRVAMEVLRDAGIIDNSTPLPRALTRQASAQGIASRLVQDELPGIDQALTRAPHYVYPEGSRPGARGLPVLSRHGHPSSLARITDPADPRQNTTTIHLERTRDTYQARVLSDIAEDAAHMRRRRATNPGPDQPPLFPDDEGDT